MLVKDLQQFLETFTDKLKGNAISYARIYVEKDGYLEDITRMEVQEHKIIGEKEFFKPKDCYWNEDGA